MGLDALGVVKKRIPDILYAGTWFVMRENWELDRQFERLRRELSDEINGPATAIYNYGLEVAEGKTVFACYPVKNTIKLGRIDSRLLLGGDFFSVLHQGTYDSKAESYRKIIAINEKLKSSVIREVFHRCDHVNPDNNKIEIIVESRY